MPFAGYVDFDDCVRKNQDKENPAAYCATIQRMAEGGRRPDTSQQTSAQRGEESVAREIERRTRPDRRRSAYGTPGFLNRRRGDRRST